MLEFLEEIQDNFSFVCGSGTYSNDGASPQILRERGEGGWSQRPKVKYYKNLNWNFQRGVKSWVGGQTKKIDISFTKICPNKLGKCKIRST